MPEDLSTGSDAAHVYGSLRVTAGAVTLRAVPWADIERYAHLVSVGLFAPGETPTIGPWYDPDDLVTSGRRLVGYHLSRWANLSPDDWALDFGIYVDEALIGRQVMETDDFLRTRTVRTGSFLIPGERGHGHGKQARAAILHLAFDVLGAQLAKTAALPNNSASRGVSLALGYSEVGLKTVTAGGRPYEVERFWLERDRWEKSALPWPVATIGAEPLLRLLGIAAR